MSPTQFNQSGCFIVFEGIDGAGKSSYLNLAQKLLSEYGYAPLMTREPGGTALGETLRELVLHQPMDLKTECLLMFAARQQHISEVINPALQAGQIVISDRFTDATYAYQGAGRGFPASSIAVLENWVQNELRPDHVLLFDLEPAEAERRRSQVREADKFEALDMAFFNRVRDAYLERARARPQAYHVINTAKPKDEVAEQVTAVMKKIDNELKIKASA